MADDGTAVVTGRDAEIKELREESKGYRLQLRGAEKANEALTAERDALKTKVDGHDAAVKKAVEDALAPVAKDRDKYKATAETTGDEWKTKYDEAMGTIRTRDHLDAFGRIATTLNLNPDAVSDAFDIATARHGYKAESDAPDEAAIKGVLGEVLKGRAWMLKPKADPSDKGTDSPTAPDGQNRPLTLSAKGPGPGAERGQTDTTKPLTTVAQKVEADFAQTGRTSSKKL